MHMPKISLVVLFLTVILITSFLSVKLNPANNLYKAGSWPEADKAINQAENVYKMKKEKGDNFDLAGCLSNDLLPGWVADLVHNPREAADDLPENQCPALLEGRAIHIVEMDINGKLIKLE